ncbi:MAG: hypothetical protein AMXMBFR64_36420 [Myxococcales bacterium]
MKKAAVLAGFGLIAIVAVACQPAAQEPIKCVCNCDGPPPEGAKVTVQGPAPAAAPAVAAAPTPAAAVPAAPAPSPGVASGSVPQEPGTGAPVQVSDADKEEMKKAFSAFAAAAGSRNMDEMRKWTTERLGGSLAGAVEKYKDRLFSRTDIFTKGAAGGVTVGSVLEGGPGNFDVEFKFSNGESARVLFFKENGAWKLNRL